MSDDNVVVLPVVTRLAVPVDRVLKSALEAGLTEVVVIGYDADGDHYFSSSEPDGPSVLWAMERAKLRLLRVED